MSTPATTPTLEIQEGFLYLVRKGTDVLGQMLSVEMSVQTPTRKLPRLGDTQKIISYGASEFSFRCELYTEKDPDQLAKLLAGTQKPTTGGWEGTETLKINSAVAPYDLLIDVYGTNTGTSDAKVGTWTVKNFKPTQLQIRIQSENASTISMTGEPTEWYLGPAAGVGA